MISLANLRTYKPKGLPRGQWDYTTSWHHGYYELYDPYPGVSFGYGRNSSNSSIVIVDLAALKVKRDPFTGKESKSIDQQAIRYTNQVCVDIDSPELLGKSLSSVKSYLEGEFTGKFKFTRLDHCTICVVDCDSVSTQLVFFDISGELLCLALTIYDMKLIEDNHVNSKFDRVEFLTP